MSAAEIAEILGINQKAVKTRLLRAGIQPVAYVGGGPTALYAPDVVDKIREVPGRGRPKKAKPE